MDSDFGKQSGKCTKKNAMDRQRSQCTPSDGSMSSSPDVIAIGYIKGVDKKKLKIICILCNRVASDVL